MQETVNSIGMSFVPIPEGSFLMGLTAPELVDVEPYSESFPPHRVEMRGRRAMSRHLVRVGDWKAVHLDLGDRKINADINHPMTEVSWQDAMEFCQILSCMSVEVEEGRTYRLPTEAEWEYMCRAGSEGLFTRGVTEDNLAEYAWYFDSWQPKHSSTSHKLARPRSMPVGMLQPNAWGLFDMHGNVFEWCLDSYDPTIYDYLKERTLVNPIVLRANESPRARGVVRGGSVNSPALRCGCGVRWSGGRAKSARYPDVGFRVVLDGDSGSLVNVSN